MDRGLAGRIRDAASAAGVPGGAVAVLRRGCVDEVATFGTVALGSVAAVEEGTPFRIGSLTKPLFAFAALGVLEALGRPLRRPLAPADLGVAVRDWPKGMPEVTPGHLLSHCAGLPSAAALGTVVAREPEARVLGALRRVGEVVPVGATFKYSNLGYALAGTVIERLCAGDLGTVLAEHALSPLGLDATGFAPRIPAHAEGHVRAWETGAVRVAPPVPPDPFHAPAGFLWSDIGDLARLAEALAGTACGESVRRRLAHMATPHSDAFTPADHRYGLGLFVHRDRGGLRVGHDGGIAGYGAVLEVAPDSGDGIVLLLNGAGVGLSPRGLIATAAGETAAVPPPHAAAPSLPAEGWYVSAAAGLVRIGRRGGGATIERDGGEIRLEPTGGGFAARDGGGPLVLYRAPEGPGDRFHLNGEPVRRIRLRARCRARFDPGWYGSYGDLFPVRVFARDGVVHAASDLWGTAHPCRVLGRRSLACRAGLLLFQRRDGIRCLHLGDFGILAEQGAQEVG